MLLYSVTYSFERHFKKLKDAKDFIMSLNEDAFISSLRFSGNEIKHIRCVAFINIDDGIYCKL